MVNIASLERLSAATDQKKELTKLVGDLSGVNILSNRILVGIYIEPEKTKGGLFLATSTVKESVFQGVVGLVLKKGVTAFRDEPESNTYFHSQDVKVGEWVVFRTGDARRVQINGVDCRMVDDTLIDMIVADPNCITHR